MFHLKTLPQISLPQGYFSFSPLFSKHIFRIRKPSDEANFRDLCSVVSFQISSISKYIRSKSIPFLDQIFNCQRYGNFICWIFFGLSHGGRLVVWIHPNICKTIHLRRTTPGVGGRMDAGCICSRQPIYRRISRQNHSHIVIFLFSGFCFGDRRIFTGFHWFLNPSHLIASNYSIHAFVWLL